MVNFMLCEFHLNLKKEKDEWPMAPYSKGKTQKPLMFPHPAAPSYLARKPALTSPRHPNLPF